MLDIALDLPPPAAVMRRSVVSQQPVYDMGPILPGVQVWNKCGISQRLRG